MSQWKLTYAVRVLIALDQLGNALLGGWPDETFSSRCWGESSASQKPGITSSRGAPKNWAASRMGLA